MDGCQICLSPCPNACETPCGHRFHYSCLACFLLPAMYRAIKSGRIRCQSTTVSRCPCCTDKIECWFVLAVIAGAMEACPGRPRTRRAPCS